DLLLQGASRYASRSLGLGGGFLARRALQLLSFGPVRCVFCIHQSVFNPAYFSISFLSPCPGKLTVSFASSPSPSRLTITPLPYLGWLTVDPVFLGACGLGGEGGAGFGCRGG